MSLISSRAKSAICSFVTTLIDMPRSSIFEFSRVPDIVFGAKYPRESEMTSKGDRTTVSAAGGLEVDLTGAGATWATATVTLA